MNSLCLEHVSEKLLERYLAQQGSESEVEVVETHLLICDSCQSRLDELEDYRSVVRQGFALLASQPQKSKALGWGRTTTAPSWCWRSFTLSDSRISCGTVVCPLSVRVDVDIDQY